MGIGSRCSKWHMQAEGVASSKDEVAPFVLGWAVGVGSAGDPRAGAGSMPPSRPAPRPLCSDKQHRGRTVATGAGEVRARGPHLSLVPGTFHASPTRLAQARLTCTGPP